MLFNISLFIIVAKSLTMALVEPIFELHAALRKVKDGDSDVEIKYESQDEFGELADDLREVCSQIYTVVSDAGYVLGEMAEGRFNVSSNKEDRYVGEFKTLIAAIEAARAGEAGRGVYA